MNPTIEYHPGKGYKVSHLVSGWTYHLIVYSTKKAASDVARLGGWKRTDVVRVWGPLFGGWMPAYASQNGKGENTLIFLTPALNTYEFVVEDMPVKRQIA